MTLNAARSLAVLAATLCASAASVQAQSWSAPQPLPVPTLSDNGAAVVDITPIDINLDGLPDIVFRRKGASVATDAGDAATTTINDEEPYFTRTDFYLALNRGAGTYTPLRLFADMDMYTSDLARMIDMNGDGYPDLAALNRGVFTVMENLGGGDFGPQTSYPSINVGFTESGYTVPRSLGVNSTHVWLRRANPNVDVPVKLYTRGSGSVGGWRDATLRRQKNLAPGDYWSQGSAEAFAKLVDRTGDDIVTVADGKVALTSSDLGRVFPAARESAVYKNFPSVHLVDLDNDGAIDVLYTGRSARASDGGAACNGEIAWIKNDGTYAGFGRRVTVIADRVPLWDDGETPFVSVGDIDGDGFADLVVRTRTGVSWIRNNADGTFGTALQPIYVAATPDVYRHSEPLLALLDVDSDGRLDVVTKLANGSIVWLKNSIPTSIRSARAPTSRTPPPVGPSRPKAQFEQAQSIVSTNGPVRQVVVTDDRRVVYTWGGDSVTIGDAAVFRAAADGPDRPSDSFVSPAVSKSGDTFIVLADDPNRPLIRIDAASGRAETIRGTSNLNRVFVSSNNKLWASEANPVTSIMVYEQQQLNGPWTLTRTIDRDPTFDRCGFVEDGDYIITSTSRSILLINKNTNQIHQEIETDGAGAMACPRRVDIDGDGVADLAYIVYDVDADASYVAWSKGLGGATGSFSRERVRLSDIKEMRSINAVEFVDMDNDGRPDMIINMRNERQTVVHKNLGGGGGGRLLFAEGIAIRTTGLAESITIADFDGDKVPDILIPVGSQILRFRNAVNGFVLPSPDPNGNPPAASSPSPSSPGTSTGNSSGAASLTMVAGASATVLAMIAPVFLLVSALV